MGNCIQCARTEVGIYLFTWLMNLMSKAGSYYNNSKS